MTPSAISQWESGARVPNEENLMALCVFFRVPKHEFYNSIDALEVLRLSCSFLQDLLADAMANLRSTEISRKRLAIEEFRLYSDLVGTKEIIEKEIATRMIQSQDQSRNQQLEDGMDRLSLGINPDGTPFEPEDQALVEMEDDEDVDA